MELILSAISAGLIFSFLGLGVYIAFRILDAPDLTIDGTFTLGALMMMISMNSIQNTLIGFVIGLIASIICGGIGGIVTGLLHTKLHVNVVLSGILTMTALYTINLRLYGGKSNGFIQKTVFYNVYDTRGILLNILILAIILFIVFLIVYLFFKTRTGMAIRATGDNEAMIEASSISPQKMKIIGFFLANALAGLSGGIYVAVQTSYDSTYGNGKFVMAVAAIIIGESIFLKKKSLLFGLLASILGSIIYQILFALAIKVGAKAMDLKLISTIIIILAISLPLLISKIKNMGVKKYADN